MANPNYVCRRCNGEALAHPWQDYDWSDVDYTTLDVWATFCGKSGNFKGSTSGDLNVVRDLKIPSRIDLCIYGTFSLKLTTP